MRACLFGTPLCRAIPHWLHPSSTLFFCSTRACGGALGSQVVCERACPMPPASRHRLSEFPSPFPYLFLHGAYGALHPQISPPPRSALPSPYSVSQRPTRSLATALPRRSACVHTCPPPSTAYSHKKKGVSVCRAKAMGRSKRSKAAARARSSGNEKDEEERDESHTTILPGRAEGCEDVIGTSVAADGAQATPGQRSGHCSEEDSDSEEAAPKKKVYRGNRLKKMENQRKKKEKGANEVKKAEEAAIAGGADDEPLVVTRQRAVEVLYCPICTFPAEMCEFSGVVEKCRPWLLENAAELADAEERGRKRRILTEKDRLEAMLEGRGVKKALERIVMLEVDKRVGQRMITSVFGMDLFGFNLKDLSKEWRKRFSCGAGVRAAEEGKHQDCIDIQGNVVDQLADMLITKYKIPKESVYLMEDKKKVPYPY
ncbi:hypothetical protein, conserved [Leishmania tarentolae]|uniref:SUI1 domain-containing protein n=1 Tax=Leishmania tarentolae TaxID=5689 RepID=A0A640KIT1_LEITA|nr:hypothetical protein, conserved [Leishmania tarentolae]